MADDRKEGKEPVKPAATKLIKFYFTEVVAMRYDKSLNCTVVSCADGSQYNLDVTESTPKIHAKVTVTVEIDL